MSPDKRGAIQPLVRLVPLAVFLSVFILHAFFVSHSTGGPTTEWADSGIRDAGLLGLAPYFQRQDYFIGFSYALGAAFAVWALGKFIQTRQAALAAGAAGSVTLVGILMAAGCFLIGCCGSPMLAVYASILGVKAFGAGKPLMAVVTLISVGCGYWYLSRRLNDGGCIENCCE